MGLLDIFSPPDVSGNDAYNVSIAQSLGAVPASAPTVSASSPAAVATAASLPTKTNWLDSLTETAQSIKVIGGAVVDQVNRLNPTVNVKGDLSGTLSDAKNALPWWALPAFGLLVAVMLLKPSGGGGGRRRY